MRIDAWQVPFNYSKAATWVRTFFRNKTFLFVKLGSWNFVRFHESFIMKILKTSAFYLDKQKSFAPERLCHPAKFISCQTCQSNIVTWPSMRLNGISLPKFFWPTLRKNCSSDQEILLKFEAEGREFANFLRSLEQFIQRVKGQNKFGNRMLFKLVPGSFSYHNPNIFLQFEF